MSKLVYKVFGNFVDVHNKDGRFARIHANRTITLNGESPSKDRTKLLDYQQYANPVNGNGENPFNTDVRAMYIITGVDRSGKRFTPIWTHSPQHYNIWKGTLWKYVNGNRRLVKHYIN